MIVITEPAIISSGSRVCSSIKLARATGKVYIDSSVRAINGQRKSFHVPRKVNIPSVTKIGVTRGRIILL